MLKLYHVQIREEKRESRLVDQESSFHCLAMHKQNKLICLY